MTNSYADNNRENCRTDQNHSLRHVASRQSKKCRNLPITSRNNASDSLTCFLGFQRNYLIPVGLSGLRTAQHSRKRCVNAHDGGMHDMQWLTRPGGAGGWGCDRTCRATQVPNYQWDMTVPVIPMPYNSNDRDARGGRIRSKGNEQRHASGAL